MEWRERRGAWEGREGEGTGGAGRGWRREARDGEAKRGLVLSAGSGLAVYSRDGHPHRMRMFDRPASGMEISDTGRRGPDPARRAHPCANHDDAFAKLPQLSYLSRSPQASVSLPALLC